MCIRVLDLLHSLQEGNDLFLCACLSVHGGGLYVTTTPDVIGSNRSFGYPAPVQACSLGVPTQSPNSTLPLPPLQPLISTLCQELISWHSTFQCSNKKAFHLKANHKCISYIPHYTRIPFHILVQLGPSLWTERQTDRHDQNITFFAHYVWFTDSNRSILSRLRMNILIWALVTVIKV